jgi:hypothetical protein
VFDNSSHLYYYHFNYYSFGACMKITNKRGKALFFSTFLGVASFANAMTVDELAAQFEAYKIQQALEMEEIRDKNDDLRAQNFVLKSQIEKTQQQVENNSNAVEIVSDSYEDEVQTTHWYDKTTIGGYGELHYNNWTSTDGKKDKDEIDFHRFVLFFGHEFTDKIHFYSELELEHAVSGGDKSGEVELEQAYIQYDFTEQASAKAGVVLMPVGIINETHEPPTFYGVERNQVEKFIIPATWWEAGLFGNYHFDNGISVDAGVATGLDVDNSVYIRGGRGKVSKQKAKDGALAGRVKYTGLPGLELSASLIWEANMSQSSSDVDVGGGFLSEVHAIYSHKLGPGLLQGRALYSRWDIDSSIADADSQWGWYIEPAYRLPTSIGDIGIYGRYEKLDYYKKTKQELARYEGGVNWWLHEHVVFKADYFYEDGQSGDRANIQGFDFGIGYQF